MKLALFLLPLLLPTRAATPPAVQVTFSSLTQGAYERARAGCLVTRPARTFSLRKQGGRLTIPTTKGPRVFIDRHVGTDEVDQAEYTYRGYLPAVQTHLVQASLYERTIYFLLTPDGRETVVYDEPVYAPDGRSFVSASEGLEYSVYPNVIRLFRYANGQWHEAWHLEPTTWEPEAICWLSATTLLLRRETWTAQTPGGAYTYAQLTLH